LPDLSEIPAGPPVAETTMTTMTTKAAKKQAGWAL
jgi:hypothetical protein